MENITAILIIVVCLGIFAYVIHKSGAIQKDEFDEYQKLLRGQGYRYAFYGILITIVGLLIATEMLEIPLTHSFIYFLLIYVGLSVYVGYSLWTGAYFPINKTSSITPKGTFIFFLIFGVFGLITNFPVRFGEYGNVESLLLALFELQCAFIIGLKMLTDKRDKE